MRVYGVGWGRLSVEKIGVIGRGELVHIDISPNDSHAAAAMNK